MCSIIFDEQDATFFEGPATVRMVSNSGPPLPMPMQVPPGHMVQQIIDENGILTNVILSSQPTGLSAPPVVVGYYGNPSSSPHHHHMYPPFGPAHYATYPPQYPVHHHHMHHHVGQPRMCTTSPNSLHHCNSHHPPAPPIPPYPHQNNPHFNPPNVLPHPNHHHHHHHFSANHLEERFPGRGFKSRPPNARSFVKFKDNNIIRSDHHHPHPLYFPSPPPPLPPPPPPHMHPGHLPPHRLPMPSYLRSIVPLRHIYRTHNNDDDNNNNNNNNDNNNNNNYNDNWPEVNGNTRPRSLSTSSDDQELEEERQLIREVLSRISPPKVVEVGSRCTLILLTPPEYNQQELEVDFTEFIYELHLSEKDESNFNSVYSGDATEITLRDLKPATVYFIKVHSTLDNISGTASDSVSFTTSSCEPEPPQVPKLISKSTSSLFLKWNAAIDNGSPITGYSLEYDQGSGDMNLVEIYNGNQRQYKTVKLNPATGYTFRLSAYNALGRSEYSRMVCHHTSGTAPTQPDPPMLSESFTTNLTVSWIRRPNDDHFTLMILDESTEAKGFTVIYSGTGLSFNVSDLYRNSEYKFKLQASNEEGISEWSDVVKYKTLADKPHPCSKPLLEGEVTPDSFTIVWETPQDNGGQEIIRYLVQVDDGKEKILKTCETRQYRAGELEPGHNYLLTVASINSIGTSHWSEEAKITTKCLPPGMCSEPELNGKPQANCTLIKWKCPEITGGSEVTNYDIVMVDDEDNTNVVWSGDDTSCTVSCMLPGRKYLFKVRASNDAGTGPWSESLEVTSGALPPDAPNPPVVTCSSPHYAVVSWEEPACNGATIVEYKLEWQQLESEFSQLYNGTDLSAEVSGLLAASLYNFRVQAINSTGCGAFSAATSCMTPPSHPGPVTCIHASSTSNSIGLSWKEPLDNGNKITGYYLSIDDRGVVPLDITNGLEYVIEDLTHETVYRIKLQAVNSIGLGPFSTTLKIATHAPPPPPPILECVATTCNSLKLKWRDMKARLDSISCGSSINSGCGGSGSGGSAGQMSYCLEMLREDGGFYPLYHGPGHCFKVVKLSELTEYQYRVCSVNQDGQGPYSEVFKFTTSKAPPPIIKSPKVGYITTEACSVEWPGLKTMGQDYLFYILQMQSVFGRDQTFKEIYRGPSTTHRVCGLLPSSEYRLRVCAVRQSKDSSNQELIGSFSQTTSFVTAALKSSNHVSTELVATTTKSSTEGSSSGLGWTDQQWAIALLVCFALFAILVAFLAQQIISHHQQQHSGVGENSDCILSSSGESTIPSVVMATSERKDQI